MKDIKNILLCTGNKISISSLVQHLTVLLQNNQLCIMFAERGTSRRLRPRTTDLTLTRLDSSEAMFMWECKHLNISTMSANSLLCNRVSILCAHNLSVYDKSLIS